MAFHITLITSHYITSVVNFAVVLRRFSACRHVSCQHRHAVNSSTDLTETRRATHHVPESHSLVAGQKDEARAVLPAPVV